MEKTLSMGAFTELDEREVMETEGGVLTEIIVGVACAVVIVGVGALIAGPVNDTRRNAAQVEANQKGEPVTKTLIGFNSTYTAYPDPNYVDPLDYTKW